MVDSRFEHRHIPALDGMRGVAIIAVILCHVNQAYGGPFSAGNVDGPAAMVFASGWIGVDLFFVLSGFLITGILDDAKGCDGYFRNFFARRALRIMPLYFGFLLCIVLLNRLRLLTDVWLSPDGLLSLVTYTYNFRVGVGGGFIGGLHHFWSLAIEEHFYLLWPLVVMALNRRTLMLTCIAVLLISPILRVAVSLSGAWPPLAAFFITPCRLDALVAGSWVALAWKNPANRPRLTVWAKRFTWGTGALLLAIGVRQGHFVPDADPVRMPQVSSDGFLVVTIGLAGLAVFFSALMVLALHEEGKTRIRRVMECKGLCAVGRYSYAIYVFHALILLLIVQWSSMEDFLPLYAAKTVAAAWVLAATFVVAWLSYHLYEKHFLRLKGHFEYRKPLRVPIDVRTEGQSVINA